ncbi:MAG: hypothetical protein OEY33_06460, partial [Bdellovibrionales bacterium]|nr:hypothetical protein [Bdellovibrionales bacterium]
MSTHLDMFDAKRSFKENWMTYHDITSKNKGPVPAWYPTDTEIKNTNLYSCWKECGFSSYEEFYKWSIQDKKDFWDYVVKKLGIIFDNHQDGPHEIEDVENPVWFPKSKLNIAKSCFQAPGEKNAIIFQKEGGQIETLSYKRLDEFSNQIAQGLLDNGLR